jgi:hypothetical protein
VNAVNANSARLDLSMKNLALAAGVVVLTLAGLAPTSTATSGGRQLLHETLDVRAASSCPHPQNLHATRSLRRTLRKTHSAFLRRFNSPRVRHGPAGRVYVGRCGSRQYAAATFVHAVTGETDQPEWFSRRGHRHWRDRGDTGGELASSGIPKPLLRVWGVV